MFIVQISQQEQKTVQFTPLVLEHTLLQSHLLWGEFRFCALCCSYSQSLQFIFLVPPGTHHCWVDRSSVIWEACPTPLHMTGSVTRAAVTHPSTNRAQRCLTSVLWRELITIRPCANAFCCDIFPESWTWGVMDTQIILSLLDTYNY